MNRIEELKAAGYTIKADRFGYSVYLNGVFLSGAGIVGNPKDDKYSPGSFKHTAQAWLVAGQHYELNKIVD
jgi:hypothetical protein